jgi:hypothetical protein
VDPFDVESIRRGFQRVIRDANYRQELIDLGYKNAARYRADVIAQQYADLYATLIETNGAR